MSNFVSWEISYKKDYDGHTDKIDYLRVIINF